MLIIRLLRPHQYIKNAFVFLGAIFAHKWDASTLLQVGLVFTSFCAMASCVYVLNDVVDIQADRRHPKKCNRPIASGAVSITTAWSIFLILAVISFAIAFAISSWVLLFVVTYLILNIAYSWRLKHVVILDVFIISAGFMLRILAGTKGIGIEPSQWLLLCGLMLTLFLGFAKRRAELLMLESAGTPDKASTRRVLDDYSPAMLEQYIAVSAACTVLSYGLYTVSPETVAAHGSTNLIYTLPFVVYGIFRYLFLLHHRAQGNDTARDLLTDRHMLLTVLAWIAVTMSILA